MCILAKVSYFIWSEYERFGPLKSLKYGLKHVRSERIAYSETSIGFFSQRNIQIPD